MQNKGIEEEEYKDIDFKDMKQFIFSEFTNRKMDDENDIKSIMELIECLKGKQIEMKEFLNQLMIKKLFTKEEFFKSSKTQNLKISLLSKLYEKEILAVVEGEYNEKINELLNDIYKNLEGEIKKEHLMIFWKMKNLL